MMMMMMTLTFLMKQLKPQMIMTTMSLEPNIQILPSVIFLGHESQGLHNHRHLAFFVIFTHRLNFICKSTWWPKHIFFQLYFFK
jgi:hypothetical protein